MEKDVDLIHCDHLGYNNECTASYDLECGKLKRFKRCKDMLDCYYRQLQRKIQECEELKNRLTVLDGEILTVEITVEEYEKFLKQKQIIEQIKDYCNEHNSDLTYNRWKIIDILDMIEKGCNNG